jgi:hypothetical protein
MTSAIVSEARWGSAVLEGAPYRYYVHPAVFERIETLHLYRDG